MDTTLKSMEGNLIYQRGKNEGERQRLFDELAEREFDRGEALVITANIFAKKELPQSDGYNEKNWFQFSLGYMIGYKHAHVLFESSSFTYVQAREMVFPALLQHRED